MLNDVDCRTATCIHCTFQKMKKRPNSVLHVFFCGTAEILGCTWREKTIWMAKYHDSQRYTDSSKAWNAHFGGQEDNAIHNYYAQSTEERCKNKYGKTNKTGHVNRKSASKHNQASLNKD